MSKGDCTWGPDFDATDEGIRLSTRKLALKQSREF